MDLGARIGSEMSLGAFSPGLIGPLQPLFSAMQVSSEMFSINHTTTAEVCSERKCPHV